MEEYSLYCWHPFRHRSWEEQGERTRRIKTQAIHQMGKWATTFCTEHICTLQFETMINRLIRSSRFIKKDACVSPRDIHALSLFPDLDIPIDIILRTRGATGVVERGTNLPRRVTGQGAKASLDLHFKLVKLGPHCIE